MVGQRQRQTYDNVKVAKSGREMQRGVAFVCEVRVLQHVRVVLSYPLDEEEVVQVYGSLEPDGRVNHLYEVLPCLLHWVCLS